MTRPDRPTATGDHDVKARSWFHDVLGVAWLFAVAGAIMAPALSRGLHLGPYDLLSLYGVTKDTAVIPHNWTQGDLITLVIPWTKLAWTQVHHGQLPLWNPYSALGMPLAFNWQSGVFSVPTLISYLVPLQFAFDVQVIGTLVLAGTGVYVLGRVMHLGTMACAFGATVYELSGPVMGWLGWPQATTMAWAGWMIAAAILVIRGRHRARAVVLLAVVVACAIYAGQPDVYGFLGLSLVIVVAVLLVARRAGSASTRRSIVDLTLGVVAGAALAAPLLLPGLQVLGQSDRKLTTAVGDKALPLHNLSHVIFSSFDGIPVHGSQTFGRGFASLLYTETAAYVGVIAVVLAVVALGVRWRKPEVLALGIVTIVMAAIVFAPPVMKLMIQLPIIGTNHWHRALLALALGLATLAGAGMDVLVRSHTERAARRWAGGGFLGVALVLVAVWLFGRGHLPPLETATRAKSFLWPVIDCAVGLAVVGVLIVLPRKLLRRRPNIAWFAGALLFAGETIFLINAGSPLMSSSPTFLPTTPAEVAFQRAVGSSLVGFGASTCWNLGGAALGIQPSANIAFGIHELAVYDPITPEAYYRSLGRGFKNARQFQDVYTLCPVVSTVAQARLYGVGFILEPQGVPGPTGTVFDRELNNEGLFRVPGATSATLVPLGDGEGFPGPDAPGVPVDVSHPDAASWHITTDTADREVLRLRLTDVPGWHATIDGRPLPLHSFAGVMFEASIPGGRHTIDLYYWPEAFTAGIAIAFVSAVGLFTALLVGRRTRRRGAYPPTADRDRHGISVQPTSAPSASEEPIPHL